MIDSERGGKRGREGSATHLEEFIQVTDKLVHEVYIGYEWENVR